MIEVAKHQISKVSWHYKLLSFMYVNPLWGQASNHWTKRGLDRVRTLWGYWLRVAFAVVIFVPLAILLIPGMIVGAAAEPHFEWNYNAKTIGWLFQVGALFVLTLIPAIAAGELCFLLWGFFFFAYAVESILIGGSIYRDVAAKKKIQTIEFV